MSYYLAAASACDSSTAGEGAVPSADAERQPSLRARLEESLQHSISSLEIRERQEVRIAQKEQLRLERDLARAEEQRRRNDELLASIARSREERGGLAGQSSLPRTSQTASYGQREDSPADALGSLGAIDAFRRLRIEEERCRRMALPVEGIAGLYNTMQRPLSTTDMPEGVACIPTVATLIDDEGRGVQAVAARKHAHHERREAMHTLAREVSRAEGVEQDEEAHRALCRGLERYDTLRTAPHPVRITPYALPTVLPAGEESELNPFRMVPSEHPLDAYHSMIRNTGVPGNLQSR